MTSFGGSIIQWSKLAEVSIVKRVKEPSRVEKWVVCTVIFSHGNVVPWIVVCCRLVSMPQDMLNGGNILHGGCSALLINTYVHIHTVDSRFSINRLFHRCLTLANIASVLHETGKSGWNIS